MHQSAKKLSIYTAIFLLIGIGLAPVLSMFIKSFIVNCEFSIKNYMGYCFNQTRDGGYDKYQGHILSIKY